MDEITTFMKTINDYFQSENLGTKFMKILSRLKKIDSYTMIQKRTIASLYIQKKKCLE